MPALSKVKGRYMYSDHCRNIELDHSTAAPSLQFPYHHINSQKALGEADHDHVQSTQFYSVNKNKQSLFSLKTMTQDPFQSFSVFF